jgi:hypothetical protein
MTRRRTSPRPALPERKCAYCGHAYRPDRASQRFCSPKHRQTAKAGRRRERLKARLAELEAKIAELESKP